MASLGRIGEAFHPYASVFVFQAILFGADCLSGTF